MSVATHEGRIKFKSLFTTNSKDSGFLSDPFVLSDVTFGSFRFPTGFAAGNYNFYVASLNGLDGAPVIGDFFKLELEDLSGDWADRVITVQRGVALPNPIYNFNWGAIWVSADPGTTEIPLFTRTN